MKGNIICLLTLTFTIPVVLYIFSKEPPHRAVIICFFGAVLFLPMEKLQVPLILYNKMSATGMGVIAAILMFDGDRIREYPFKAVDIPMVVWLLSGIFASLLNGLGLKDGLQEAFNTFMLWAVPFIAGRLYFSSYQNQVILCRAFFIAGLMYIPFIVFELVMSPQAHRIVYGYMQHDFSQVIRGGGYRPMVFMQHGIMLGTFMCMSAFVGLWCWFTKVFPKKMWGIPTWMLSLTLLICAVACKSSGAIGLLFMGIIVLIATVKLKTRLIVFIVLILPVIYVGSRASGSWDGQNLVDFIAEKFSEDRSLSLQFRLDNENILIEKALEKPVFGWGGWGRSRVYDEDTGEDKSTTDGFWIITLGRWGFVGLISISLVFLLPMLMFVMKHHPKRWKEPEIAPGAVIALIPLLFLIDCSLNAMVNQMYIIFAGAVVGMSKQADSAVDLNEEIMKDHKGQKPFVKIPDSDIEDKKKPFTINTRLNLTKNYSGPRFNVGVGSKKL